ILRVPPEVEIHASHLAGGFTFLQREEFLQTRRVDIVRWWLIFDCVNPFHKLHRIVDSCGGSGQGGCQQNREGSIFHRITSPAATGTSTRRAKSWRKLPEVRHGSAHWTPRCSRS